MNILQCNACSFGYTVQGVVRYVEGNVDLVLQTSCQTSEQRTASGQVDAVVYNVGIQFGRSVFQRVQNGGLNLDRKSVV